MTFNVRKALCLAAAVVSLAGCRGQRSSEPPVHLNPNMDSQPRYDAQAESAFFADSRTMRAPPKGTVPVGFLHEDDVLELGVDASGTPLSVIPIEVTQEVLARGENRFNIYCMPCHDPTGSGNGMVGRRWPIPVPNFHDKARMAEVSDGRIYAAVTNGFSTMPSYKSQIPNAADRWAVVAWVRTLQQARDATLDEVPVAQRAQLK